MNPCFSCPYMHGSIECKECYMRSLEDQNKQLREALQRWQTAFELSKSNRSSDLDAIYAQGQEALKQEE